MPGDGYHAPRPSVTWAAVVAVVTLRVGETARPFVGHACLQPSRDQPLETSAPHGKELRAVVEGAFAHVAGGYASSDLAGSFQHHDAPAGGL